MSSSMRPALYDAATSVGVTASTMITLKSAVLFALAAVAEIGGAWLLGQAEGSPSSAKPQIHPPTHAAPLRHGCS